MHLGIPFGMRHRLAVQLVVLIGPVRKAMVSKAAHSFAQEPAAELSSVADLSQLQIAVCFAVDSELKQRAEAAINKA